MTYNLLKKTFANKKVLVTGHTGFKGAWLSLLLNELGADVYGYALDPPTKPSLFVEAGVEQLIKSYIGDIRDFKYLSEVFHEIKPEIVIHMAAQSLVIESYKNPIETYATNVMGTVNLFEAVKHTKSVKVVINITSDKCYENREWHWGYRESDSLGGFDPYSNSKGCSEMVTNAFRNSFFNLKEFNKHGVAIASARAGNVIGGGDFAENRLIPDFFKAVINNEKLLIRCPLAIRPWQHVLEPLTGYLLLAKKLLDDGANYSGAWNFGPHDTDSKNVEWIVKEICTMWGNGASYDIEKNNQPHEANYLKLDCSKARAELGWQPHWDIVKALQSIIEWHKNRILGKNIRQVTINQINTYYNL